MGRGWAYGHGLFVLYLTPSPLYKGLVEPNYEGSLNQVRSSRLRKIPKHYVKRVKLIFSTNMRFSFDGQTKILRPQSASIDSAPALSRLHLFTTHRPTPFRTHPLICALQPSWTTLQSCYVSILIAHWKKRQNPKPQDISQVASCIDEQCQDAMNHKNKSFIRCMIQIYYYYIM